MPNLDRQPQGLTRRDFFKVAGAAAAGAFLIPDIRRVLAKPERQDFEPITCEIPPGTGFFAPAASPDGTKVIATIYGNGQWYGFGEFDLTKQSFRYVSPIGKDPVYTPDGRGYLAENQNNRSILFITADGLTTVFAENAQFPEVAGENISFIRETPTATLELIELKNPNFEKLEQGLSLLADEIQNKLGENPKQVLADIANRLEEPLESLRQRLPDIKITIPHFNFRDVIPDQIEELAGTREVIELPYTPGSIRFYDWTPDGKIFGISTFPKGQPDQIQLFDEQGQNLGILEVNGFNTDGVQYPAWSPNESRFAYVVTPDDGQDETWNTVIYKDDVYETTIPGIHDPVWLTNDVLIGKSPDNDLMIAYMTPTGYTLHQLSDRKYVSLNPTEQAGLTLEELSSKK